MPSVLAALTGLYGLLSLISALLPAQRDRVRELTPFVPVFASATATATTAVAGILLLQLARGLRRRKRRAWRSAIVVTTLLIALHVLKGLDVEEATLALVLLVVLVAARKEFYASGDPRSRWLAVRALPALLLAGTVSGLVLLRLYHHSVEGHPSFSQQLAQVLLGFVGISGPLRFHHDRPADVVTFTLLAFGVLTALVTAFLVLRPYQPEPHLSAQDEARLRGLLDRHGGRDSLGYFALRRDKSLVWSESGKAAVAYRVLSGVALASGDPLGDPEAWPGAIGAFLTLARDHAWVPAVMACGEQGGTAWARFGLDALEIGDEAVVEVADFTLEGRAMRGVRQAVGRASRAGYTTAVRRQRDISVAELAALAHRARTWRGSASERGFSMALSRFGDPGDGECVVVTAHHGDRLVGLLDFVPWGQDGLSLDLMRRDRSAENGVNEFLICELIATAPRLGIARVSLNFAIFRAALERGQRLGAGPVTRLWSRLLLVASRWFQIETLYRFNAKFRPIWEPRFICFPATRDLPRIILAALRAEAYLNRPAPLRGRRAVRPAETAPVSDRTVPGVR